jgi:ATP-binding cassette subfamily B protein
MNTRQQRIRDKQTTRSIHRLFWRAMTNNKKYFIVTVLLHAPAFGITHVAIPLQVAYGIQAILTKNFAAVPHYAIVIMLLAVSYNVLLGFATWAFNRDGVEGASYVQKQIFSNYLSKDYEFYSNTYVGALGAQASRMRDAFIDYNRITLFDIPKSAVIIIAGLGVIASKSILLALVTAGCMLLVLSYTIITSQLRLKYRRLVSEASSHLSGVIGDALGHGATVKSFATEEYEAKRLEAPLSAWRKAQLQSWDLFTPANTGRNLLNAFTTCALLILTSRMYQQGTITIAIVTLVQLYAVKLVGVTLDIAEIIKSYETVMGSAYEPMVTMNIRPSVRDTETPQKIISPVKHLTFDAVTFQYPDNAADIHAIDTLSFQVKQGEKIGIVGRSGSGKTTLTKLLLRFMDVSDGSIQINGIDIRNITQHDLRNLIAYVPQEPLLFHRTVLENIAYAAPKKSTEDVAEAAKLARVDAFVEDLPNGYQTLVGERGVKLSGGQRQRIAIARAILRDAPILVLDEATSSLDSESEQFIQDAFDNLMKHRTTIVIAHRLSTIQKMDRILVVDKGSVIEQGSHVELLKHKGLYAKLWAHQSGGFIEE